MPETSARAIVNRLLWVLFWTWTGLWAVFGLVRGLIDGPADAELQLVIAACYTIPIVLGWSVASVVYWIATGQWLVSISTQELKQGFVCAGVLLLLGICGYWTHKGVEWMAERWVWPPLETHLAFDTWPLLIRKAVDLIQWGVEFCVAVILLIIGVLVVLSLLDDFYNFLKPRNRTDET